MEIILSKRFWVVEALIGELAVSVLVVVVVAELAVVCIWSVGVK